MTGFLLDPVYKIPKVENNPSSSALGRKTKPYKDTVQLLRRVSSIEMCDARENMEEIVGYKVATIHISTDIFSHLDIYTVHILLIGVLILTLEFFLGTNFSK